MPKINKEILLLSLFPVCICIIFFVATFFLLGGGWIVSIGVEKLMGILFVIFWLSAGVSFLFLRPLYNSIFHNQKTSTRETPSYDSRYISSEVKASVWGKYNSNKPLRVNVENAIRSFKPRKRWQYERQYQDELYNWLKRDFPYIVEYELQTGSSRPDLVIRDIAIEIKGPTGNRELDTLTTKFLKYSNHYPHFIIVLFDCSFSEEHFNEIYNGIRKFCPNVIIIRIQN